MLVNGLEIGTHEINGTATRFTQTLSILEPVWLAEVYSEQDVCLASLDVTPLPEAPAEQRVDVALSDDRQIALVLSLTFITIPFRLTRLSYVRAQPFDSCSGLASQARSRRLSND